MEEIFLTNTSELNNVVTALKNKGLFVSGTISNNIPFPSYKDMFLKRNITAYPDSSTMTSIAAGLFFGCSNLSSVYFSQV